MWTGDVPVRAGSARVQAVGSGLAARLPAQLSPAGPGAPGAVGSPASPNLPLGQEAARARCPGHLSLRGEPASHCPQQSSETEQKLFAAGMPGLGRIHPTRDRGGAWQSKACPGHFYERGLNPWSPSFPSRPHPPGLVLGPRVPSEDGRPWSRCTPCLASCVTPTPALCPHPGGPGARLRVVQWNRVRQPQGPLWAQPAAPPALKRIQTQVRVPGAKGCG